MLHRLFFSCSEHELLSSCSAQASHHSSFSCCGTQALGVWASAVAAPVLSSCGSWAPRAQAQSLWSMGLVALRHVGSSWTRDPTRVAIREALKQGFCFLGFFALRLCCCTQASCNEQRLLSSCSAQASHCSGFSWCGAATVWAQKLQRSGLIALRPVGSSQTRDQTCVPCIGR